MKMLWRRLQGPVKGLVICVAILLAAGGACGLQLAILNHVGSNLTTVFLITGSIELVVMVLSAGGIAVAFVVWFIGWISGINTPPSDS